MNDPYEFKGLILDEHKFEEVGYPKKTIEEYKKIFEMEDIGITSARNIAEVYKDNIQSFDFLICTDGINHPDKQTVGLLRKQTFCSFYKTVEHSTGFGS